MMRTILALLLGGAIACSGNGAARTSSSPPKMGGLGIRGDGAPSTLFAPGDTEETSTLPGTATARGQIDKEAIRKTIRDHALEVLYCYERELSLNPRLEGRITMKWVIGADGLASSPQVYEPGTTLANEGVARCMMERIVTWQFPRPAGGGLAIVTYPWILRSSAQLPAEAVTGPASGPQPGTPGE